MTEEVNSADVPPTSTSSLIFPEASQSISKTLSSLKRNTLSVSNRLSSIHHDSLSVQQVAEHYRLPLIANERCGSWYIRPEIKKGSAYFKSTDGHQGQWSFSTRRLNLQVLDLVEEYAGYATFPGWEYLSELKRRQMHHRGFDTEGKEHARCTVQDHSDMVR
ncbi:MAG: hypothetical protein Q9222_002730, partial [Ikaeria aurantiellina]